MCIRDSCNYITLIISSVVDVFHMIIFFVISGAQILKSHKFAVYYDFTVMQTYRSGKASDTSGFFTHLHFVSKFYSMLRAVSYTHLDVYKRQAPGSATPIR